VDQIRAARQQRSDPNSIHIRPVDNTLKSSTNLSSSGSGQTFVVIQGASTAPRSQVLRTFARRFLNAREGRQEHVPMKRLWYLGETP